jgi:hypothetical protein
VGRPEGKILGRTKRRVDNIKIDLREIVLDSSSSEQELVENSYEHGNELSGSIKYCKILE